MKFLAIVASAAAITNQAKLYAHMQNVGQAGWTDPDYTPLAGEIPAPTDIVSNNWDPSGLPDCPDGISPEHTRIIMADQQ